jgi:peptidyl-prolyl cis-trans isomerase A (cyclophilin A)
LSISSDIANELSYLYPGKYIAIVYKKGSFTNVSMRGKNVRDILEKILKNLENATGGGHKDAVGARIRSEDLDKFKELFEKEAPITTANFLSYVNEGYYDGLIFHRIIPDFMIQGGDPLGMGIGGPGYQFEDEIAADLTFDRPGRLAMANAGPGTNGSQFFITVTATPWLNGKHTIFGQVLEGQDVVDAITLVKRDGNDKPLEPVILKKVTIKDSL